MTNNKFSRTPSDIFPPGVFELQVQYYRRSEIRIKFSNSKEVAEYARHNIYPSGSIEYVEMFYVLLLDRGNRLFAWKQISVGGLSATHIDPKLIFQTALLCHAPQIILLHNHPSGNNKPSNSDIEITKRLKTGGQLLEIEVLDHVILTKEGYYSFADEGMIQI